MIIKTTSLMNYILTSNYGQTCKMISGETVEKIRDIYGEEVLQKIVASGLYDTREYEPEFTIVGYNLSFNLFETMSGVISDLEFRDYILQYMKANNMWPMIRTVDEVYDYSVNTVLPLFVKAGLLEVGYQVGADGIYKIARWISVADKGII